MKIFEMLNIRMLHGWIVDPSEKVASIIGNDTYEDLTLKLVSSDPSGSIHSMNSSSNVSMSNSSNVSSPNSSTVTPMSPSSTPISIPTSPPSTSVVSSPTTGSASKESIKKYTKEEAVLVREWLEINSHQLSSWGLLKLHDTMKQVLFKLNHS